VKRTAAAKCQQCGKRKRPPKSFKYASRAQFEADPFCSRDCCEKFYEVGA
jgi:hypothetical protein